MPTERGIPDNDNSWPALGGKVTDTVKASKCPCSTDKEMLSTNTSNAQGLANSTKTSTGSPTTQITGSFSLESPFAMKGVYMKGPLEAGPIHHSLSVVRFTISLSAGIGG